MHGFLNLKHYRSQVERNPLLFTHIQDPQTDQVLPLTLGRTRGWGGARAYFEASLVMVSYYGYEI